MKKVCFVVSHLGSGSERLVLSLNSHPQCEIQDSGVRYGSPASLLWLFRMGHKCRDASAVYGDHLLFNSSIASKKIVPLCRPIFFIRSPRHSLDLIISKGYEPERAASYYRFRLRRICEIAKSCPDSLLLTHDDLAYYEFSDIICDYLSIRPPLSLSSTTDNTPSRCPESMIEACQEAYDRYYYFLNSLNLRRVCAKDN